VTDDIDIEDQEEQPIEDDEGAPSPDDAADTGHVEPEEE
jgi:hypothetical protein